MLPPPSTGLQPPQSHHRPPFPPEQLVMLPHPPCWVRWGWTRLPLLEGAWR